ncbi:MAG: succinyl-diaminopimelate desuccinylase [Dermatophilus congolensis]|nr:succinyl-diaminopimelate desuccinylase [Dermatophilus congolensis]
MAYLDPALDVVALTAAVCDVESVSGDEARLADAVETLLRTAPHLEVSRHGNVVVARTDLGRAERVVLAGHLDTVPISEGPHGRNLPTRLIDGVLWGRGTVDMLGGVAVQLRLALDVPEPNRDITYVFYDNEEVASHLNGLGHLADARPDLLEADFAVLLEPTGADIEGGCKGTLRVEVTVPGVAAHSGRPWMGDNAIHKAGAVVDVLRAHEARVVDVDGLTYHEGLSAVKIAGGAGNNVIPDECVVTVNYRFAPDLSGEQAVALTEQWFAPYEVQVVDLAGGARPGLDRPIAQDFVRAVAAASGGAGSAGEGDAQGSGDSHSDQDERRIQVRAKEGWTDVARFSALGVPAVNFGPGDPLLAHKDDEHCPIDQIETCLNALRRWLT